jgi:hypothetical protein
LDFYPDNSQEISIFDGGGKEYKPIIGNKGIYFSTELKPLSETRFSILFYVKDERKNFISTISNLKDDCKELLDSNSFAIKRAAEELMSEINTLSTFTPENNSAALSELTKIRNKITGLISDDKKYNIKFEERSLYLQRLKNARAFLETLKDNKTSIDSTLIKNSDLSELSSDLSLISTEISKLENNKESDFNTSIENISKKYVIDLELYVGGLKTEYQNSKEYSKLLYSEFNDLDSEFDCLFNNLYFEDYNSFFVNLETYLKESKTNEQNLNLKVIEKKKQIDAKFGGIDKIKSNLNSAWDKYNALVGQFNSKDFESAKKVEKIPFTSTEVKNNKTLLDSVSKEILSIDSLKDTFEKEYLKNDKKAVINFEDKKIDKVNYNYELASKNLDTIESKLQLIASENIALAEEQNGNKELLYDAKNSLENGDYFKAIINAKNAMFGASTSGSNVAIYGLGIVIFAIIAYVMYVLFNNRKRKKKVTYYTVPK